MNKTAIKNFSIWARKKLLDDVVYQAKQRGVSADGIAMPLPQSTGDLQFFEIGTKSPARVTGEEINQRNALVDAIRRKERDSDYKTAYNAVIEEIAYTWFNRLVAIRFMEVNDYLPSRVRVLSAENPAKHEPDMVTTPFETDLDFTEQEQDMILRLKDQNKLDELFRYLFIRQCNKLHDILPKMFEQTSDYTEMLLNISFTDKDGIVYHLVHDIPEEDWQDQVQIIGWLYQYYNAEKKDEVFAALKKNVKITKENIPAATQLFTPDWIVRYMVENSLGRLWLEGHPNEGLKSGWKYYLDEAEQEPEVQAQLDEIRKEYRTLNPQDICIIDPCAGSGHILVYAFDVLMQIYESQGYTQRDAVQSILKNNLYGLDIDERAAQLAYFAVMMKSRQYDRRIFSRGIQPHVYTIVESNDLSSMWKKGNRQMAKLFDCMKDAKEYGSILHVPEMDFDTLWQQATEKAEDPNNLPAENVILENQLPQVLALIDVAEALAQKYQIVVTNPPYMGSSGMGAKLSDYIKKNYPDSKSDLFSCFMERADSLVETNGFTSLITMESWMFLSSFEKLRNKINETKTIINMVHMPYLGKGGTSLGINFGTAAVIMKKGFIPDYNGQYEYTVYYECDENGVPFEFPTKNERWKTARQSNFSKIPGSPVAYWVNLALFSAYDRGTLLGDISTVSEGIKTGNNERFLRLWYETDSRKFSFATSDTGYKWYPHHKGGEFRKWYGNNDWVVNWENDGYEIRKSSNSGLQGQSMYFGKFAGWTKISSKGNPLRLYEKHYLFDSGAPAISNEKLPFTVALFNTKVGKYFLNVISPTLNLQVGDVKSVPLLITDEEEIEQVVKRCVSLSRADWDSFETSWDFKQHPFVCCNKGLWDCTNVAANLDHFYGPDSYLRFKSPVEKCYALWQIECQERFDSLKANEEELNRIFIDIYGLQDELTPEVDDKDVTVRRADVGRDVRSLISYAVGCMFGRYSLDMEGLILAGQPFESRFAHNPMGYKFGEPAMLEGDYISRADNGKDYLECTFFPDEDNAIPITDEPYFEDDIVKQFCKWLTVVYGADSLEDNLDFIARILGNKGNTSREVIRNYFLNDFFKDHCKIYQKRPIYWLFDSGRQNGFKCLVYMHRWDADTAGNVRVEYLHKLQRIYEREIQRAQETIDEAHDTREVARANKRKDKLQKQLKETQDYDARLGHIALSRIAIDLDDGVKVNYEKVQTGRDGQKMPILAKIY